MVYYISSKGGSAAQGRLKCPLNAEKFQNIQEEENEKETDFYNDTCRTCLDIVQ